MHVVQKLPQRVVEQSLRFGRQEGHRRIWVWGLKVHRGTIDHGGKGRGRNSRDVGGEPGQRAKA